MLSNLPPGVSASHPMIAGPDEIEVPVSCEFCSWRGTELVCTDGSFVWFECPECDVFNNYSVEEPDYGEESEEERQCAEDLANCYLPDDFPESLVTGVAQYRPGREQRQALKRLHLDR